MNALKITALVVVSALTVTGCSATKSLLAKRDNGSLDYRKSHKLDPISLPKDQAAAPFVPLYQTPAAVGTLPNFVNETGKQYQLPAPPVVKK